MMQRLWAEQRAYQARILEIQQTSSLYDPTVGTEMIPTSFITRRLETNPFIYKLADKKSDEKPNVEVLETQTSAEVQDFYDNADKKSSELVKAIQVFLMNKFALETAIPEVLDFMSTALPEDVQYAYDLETVIPKLNVSLNQQLYLDLVRNVFSCDDLTLEPTFRNNNSKESGTNTFIDQFLHEWSKANGKV